VARRRSGRFQNIDHLAHRAIGVVGRDFTILKGATMSPNRVTLTEDLIQIAETTNGGFTQAQLACLGIGWPPPHGWKRSLVGRTVARPVLDSFYAKASERRVRPERASSVSTRSVDGQAV